MPGGPPPTDSSLDGPWRAAVADDDLRRQWADADFDDATWAPIAVPGHWRATDAFAGTDGPLLYRHRFEAPPAAGPDERGWLVVEGLFSQGDVWLDGTYLGDTEGYFAPHDFEVTELLRARTEHALGIEVTCTPPPDPDAKRTLTGSWQHGPFLAATENPGGLWQPVRLHRTGPVAFRRLRVLCTEATPDRALVSFDATLDAAAAGAVAVRTTVGDVEHALEHPLAAGQNRVRWTVTVDQPERWWPRALGPQPLHDVSVEVFTADPDPDAPPRPSDARSLTIGLRSVTLRNWVLSVNGERLFLKGADVGPVGVHAPAVAAARSERDVRLALDAGLDFVRIHSHIAHPALYEAADRSGLLLWQDLPLQWGYHRSVRKQAVRQARQAVDLLGHHPAIFVWCGHNEPGAAPGRAAATDAPPRTATRFVVDQELPSWERTVLDRSVRRALSGADPTRPAIPYSGVLPHPPALDGTDTHSPLGWAHGHVLDLPAQARLVPRAVRFVSEFGAQSVPDAAGFCEPEHWPELDWDRLGAQHGAQRALLEHWSPVHPSATFDQWRARTQAHQADVVRFHVEALRRLKYRPTGGFAAFFLSDARPAVSAALVDHTGRAKPAHVALVRACRPVIVVADPLGEVAPAGAHLHLDVHVVSDLRVDIPGAVVTATVRTPAGERTTSWQGDIPADECVLVGLLHVDVPDVADVAAGPASGPPGEVVIDLDLRAGGVHATNRYAAPIADV